jgi:hypothetical protein
MRVDLVAIASTLTRAGQIAGYLEIGDDPLYGPLGDAHPRRNIAETNCRLSCDAK